MIHEKLLGIVINNPDLWREFSTNGNLFKNEHLKRLYEICDIVYKKYDKIHKDLIVNYINENGNFDIEKFYEVYDSECYDTNYKSYLKKYIEDDLIYKLRSYINQDLKDKSYIDIKYDIKEIIENVNEVDKEKTKNPQEDCYKMLEDLKDGVPIKKIPSGIDFIDTHQRGYKLNDYVIIGATESTGKTSLIINSMVKQLKTDLRIGFISCEMKRDEINRLIVCNMSGIDNLKVEDKLMTEVEKDRYLHAIENYYTKNIFIEDSLNEWEDIRQKIKVLKKEENIDIVYIDYLHYIRHKKFTSTQDRLENISKGIKTSCKELDIPHVCIVILNKIGAGEGAPDILHIKGNNEIGYDADIAILLKTFNDAVEGNFNERLVDFYYRKNRGGKRGFERQVYFPAFRRFQKYTDGI
jgi:replicative DNA helicase